MAFGSWFKNIVKGAKNVIGKVLPKVKNVAETVGRFAPLINQAGNLIGGNVGEAINTIGNGVSKFNRLRSPTELDGKANGLFGANGAGARRIVGANGSGVRRFDIPLLKE